MLEEVYSLCLQQSLTPMFAHVDRYTAFYPEQAVEEILAFDDAVIQINHEALFFRKSLKKVLGWFGQGLPIVTGSDCHNLQARAPDDDRAQAILKSKLRKGGYAAFSEFTAGLLR